MKRLVVTVLLVMLAAVAAAPAQQVRGTVRDSVSGEPIPGAVVTVLDANGRPLARTLTNEHGRFAIPATTTAGRLRVLRIGFRPRVAIIPQPADGISQVSLSLTAIPIMLEPVGVSAARCPVRRDAEQTLALAEQARAGLLAIVVARETNPGTLVRLGYQRRMDGTSDRIERQLVRADSSPRSAISFDAVRPPGEFVTRGFLEYSQGTNRFLAPDADVLLDEAFAQGYCFAIADANRRRPLQLGLRFAPAGGERGRVDIEGTLWIDTIALALVDLEYRYTGLDRSLAAFGPGGRLSFRTMPNGLVLVDRWVIRMVGVELDTIRNPGTSRIRVDQRPFVSEAGGELARARWPDGHTWEGSLGRARLHAITDSGTPAAGVMVRLPDTPYRGVTDAAGVLELRDLVPGPYGVAVRDSLLDMLDMELPVRARFTAIRDTTIAVRFRVPTAADTAATRCLADGQEGSVVTFGRVVGTDGRPVPGVQLQLWERLPPPLPDIDRGGYETGSDGLFQFCLRAPRRGMTLAVTATGDRWRDERVFRVGYEIAVMRFAYRP